MEKLNEEKFVLTKNDVIYAFPVWAVLVMSSIVLAIFCHNYLLSSIVIFKWIKYFGNEKLHFYKNKLSRFIFRRYAYTFKVVISLATAVVIMLSWFSFKAFIYSIFLSICWKEYMKVFEKRKSLI